MLRKIWQASALAFLASKACFGTAAYIGAGLGPYFADFKQDSNIVEPGAFDVINKSHTSGLGIFADIFAGYGWQHENFYWAGEIAANINSTDSKASNSELIRHNFSATDYEVRKGYSLSILPGYIFQETTLFFAHLGYSNINFKLSTSDTSLTNVNKYLDGFRYGLGIKRKILENLAFRMEHTQAKYQSTSFTTVDPISGVSKHTSIRPRT